MTNLVNDMKIEVIAGKEFEAGIYTVTHLRTMKPNKLITIKTAEKLVATGKAIIVEADKVEEQKVASKKVEKKAPKKSTQKKSQSTGTVFTEVVSQNGSLRRKSVVDKQQQEYKVKSDAFRLMSRR